MVQFPTPRLMIVSDVLSKDQSTQNCPQVPAGAIVIGRYCLLAEQFWFVDPSDKFLSATLERWASAAQLDLNWKSKLDWPITLTVRKPYSGDLLSAISAVTNDLAAQGVDFRYAISGKTLSINASPRPQTSPQTPAPSQAKETTK
jgi:Toxin co-regulated pilus biosynthesis protein Q